MFNEICIYEAKLNKLDEMAEALGKPTFELIKEGDENEKTNT